jgi:hypothetical protein
MKDLKNPLFIGVMLAIVGCIIAFAFGEWNGYWNTLMDNNTTIVGFIIAQIGIAMAVFSQIFPIKW